MTHLTSLNQYRCFLLTQNNGCVDGFKNRILLSNTDVVPFTSENSLIVHIPYNYKDEIESSTNSLRSSPLFYKIEKELKLQDLSFLNSDKRSHTFVTVKTPQKKNYLEKIRILKDHIQEGNIYEINYCVPFVYKNIDLDPLETYHRLNSISLAPFSALAKFEDQYIISSSPERFLKKYGNTLITQPIKGTHPRGSNTADDLYYKDSLLNSLKERTENVMIVDVARNDLSRLALKGTVNVDKLYEIQSFKQVHQMVSTVSCQLKENTSFKDIIHATFPMASMTGAPKIRAMQIIDEVEEMPRGAYSGCLGYIESNGDFDLSVLIRSIFYNPNEKTAWFWVGSAITALSDPEKEYEECLLKAKAMRLVLEN